MAEGDDVSNKKSSKNLDNDELSDEKEQDIQNLEISVNSATLNNSEQTTGSSGPANSLSSKFGSSTRKEENPFSFRHFLKRDLSLPGNSTYEHTGARPKVYANTVQHSPTKIDIHIDSKREKIRIADTQAKELISDGKTHRISDISSNSSLEIPFNVVDSTESKRSLYNDSLEEPVYRLNMAAEPLGMPSLPDFVQDHILVEQVYLNSNGPISVDLDNLPDFTFNANYKHASPSLRSERRHNLDYSSNRNYDYELGVASTSNGIGPAPLDLPSGVGGPVPLDLPPHLSLDLTESVNPADRRNVSPGSACPLDLPSNAGAESMRLPDFLPVHPGRTSPEPEHADEQLQSLLNELERARSELFTERSRRTRLESELESARAETEALRVDISAIRSSEAALRARLNDFRPEGSPHVDGSQAVCGSQASSSRVHSELSNFEENACRATEADLTISRLKTQIKNLKEELAMSRAEAHSLRDTQRSAAHALRHATDIAGVSLRDLLAGLEQLKSISSSLDPT
ncbi:hypothetical protein EVAR_7324_1 [Eumeta japonica]|uniref:Endosome-associated-trafficking regulator 1 n=1 Tax=Eumeta variegata TaxID=151549 RepID=A0A4C1T2U3_EUMVA|nr:hypothetical protein EVAR_7324_1 [Eumeta japonica]